MHCDHPFSIYGQFCSSPASACRRWLWRKVRHDGTRPVAYQYLADAADVKDVEHDRPQVQFSRPASLDAIF